MNKLIWIIAIVVVLLVAGGAYWMYTANPVPVYNAPAETQQKTQQLVVPAPTVGSTDTVKIASGTAGQYLTDTRGMTLYHFTKDTVGQSNCTTPACMGLWPKFYADKLTISTPLIASDFSTIKAANGTEQLAYKGQPLYFFANDIKPGDILGNGVGGFWFLVKP